MKSKKRDDFDCPDVITASDDYQTRFESKIGEYLLDVQQRVVFDVLYKQHRKPKRILELGGAHGQLTCMLLDAGHQVVVQCSKPEGFERLKKIKDQYGSSLELVVSPPGDLPFRNEEFDVVIMVRLLSHLENWAKVIQESARVSKEQIIFDYPTMMSINILSPLFFYLKKRIEGNTRRYTVFTERQIKKELNACGFSIETRARQFFLPIAIHRLWDSPKRSIAVEGFSQKIGLTKHFGSPAVLAASKRASSQ